MNKKTLIMKNRFFILLIIWTLLGAVLMYAVATSDSKNNITSVLAIVLSMAPLLGLMITLGSLKASLQFNEWLRGNKNSMYYVAG